MAGKSVTAVQDRILGEFDRVLRNGKSDDVVSRAMVRSAKLKAQQEAKQYDSTLCSGGFSVSVQEKGKAAQESEKIAKLQAIKKSAKNRDRHSMILKTIDSFEPEFFFKSEILAEDLEYYRSQTTTIIDNDSIKIDLTIDKPLSTTLRCFADIVYQKPIWVKADDFDTTGRTERAFKEVTDRVKINASLGDVLEFKKQLLKPLTEIIQKYSIADERNVETNIWNF